MHVNKQTAKQDHTDREINVTVRLLGMTDWMLWSPQETKQGTVTKSWSKNATENALSRQL